MTDDDMNRAPGTPPDNTQGNTRNGTQNGTHAGTRSGTTPITGPIQRLLRRVRAFDLRRPLVWNGLLTACWVLFAVLDVTSGGWRTVALDPEVPGTLVLLMSVAFSVPLLWRRAHPLAVLAFMAPVALVNVWSGAVIQAAYFQQIVVFNIALRLPGRALAWAGALVAAPLLAGAAHRPHSWDPLIVPHVWAFALSAMLGIVVRTRKEYTEALVDRARRLELERDQQARLAAAAERTRIAREMHDIIGHNLSVITGLADGGAYAATRSPERAAQALEAIGTTSRQALTELRRLLGVLRDHPAEADRAPQPTLDDMDELLTGVRTAGLPVRLRVHGTLPPAPPTAGRQLTVYRVVQEALTNTLKHGGTDPSPTAEVTLTYRATELEALVTDTGTGADTVGRHGPGAGGQGITGMRERASLYDGTLEAGPLPASAPVGGWQVRLRLPLEDTPS
ncbi:sensor histidine kinase [Streptomyces sp. NPDC086796]|uniref:sensor histidine kinase n=1 Tax=unclassified Streptomyces TaxID=2593676 RepID=UPI003818BEC8